MTRPFRVLFGALATMFALPLHAYGQCPGTNVYPFTANCPLPAASLNSAIAGRMAIDGANATLPDALNNLRLGPSSTGLLSTQLPIYLHSLSPPQISAIGSRMVVLGWAKTNGTSLASGAMYGGIFATTQDVAPVSPDLTTSVAYVGGAMTGRVLASEGGASTTLSATASSGAGTLSLTSVTGFVDDMGIHIVADDGLECTAQINGAPVGNDITITPVLCKTASAGALVYHARGSVKGEIPQATLDSGATGFVAAAVEASVSAKTGSLPFMKTIIGASANLDDKVNALGPYDSGIGLWAESGAVGYKVGISFDPRGGQNLVGSTGKLVKSFGGSYAGGIDFSQSAFSSSAFASPGFTVDGTGVIKLSKSGPSIWFTNTAGTVTTGGLWRQVVSGGQFLLQNNTAAGGDFSSSISPFLVDQTGYVRISAASANLRFNDTNATVTTGGLWRAIVGSGLWSMQVNTAAGGDFSTSVIPLQMNNLGDVFTAQSAALATSATSKFLFVGTFAGTPTGVPTNEAAGRSAVGVDTTNDKWCWRNTISGAWKCVTGS
jgi:hypothetical protein